MKFFGKILFWWRNLQSNQIKVARLVSPTLRNWLILLRINKMKSARPRHVPYGERSGEEKKEVRNEARRHTFKLENTKEYKSGMISFTCAERASELNLLMMWRTKAISARRAKSSY